MNIAGVRLSKLQLVIVTILIVGLVVGLFLVGTRQIFRSKASEEIYNAITITDDQGSALNCNLPIAGSATCETDSDTVDIDLSGLKNLTR